MAAAREEKLAAAAAKKETHAQAKLEKAETTKVRRGRLNWLYLIVRVRHLTSTIC